MSTGDETGPWNKSDEDSQNPNCNNMHVIHYFLKKTTLNDDPCSTSEADFRTHIAKTILKNSLDMRPRCIVCGEDQYKMFPENTCKGQRKKADYSDMDQCASCNRWIHQKQCLEENEFERDICFLCRAFAELHPKIMGNYESMNSVIYFPVTSDWQRNVCKKLNIPAAIPHKAPVLRAKRCNRPTNIIQSTQNGKDWFRTVSLIISDAEKYHARVKEIIRGYADSTENTKDIMREFMQCDLYNSLNMLRKLTDIAAAALLLETPVYLYVNIKDNLKWYKVNPKELRQKTIEKGSFAEKSEKCERAIYVVALVDGSYGIVKGMD